MTQTTKIQLQEAFKLSLSLVLFYWLALGMDWDLPKYAGLAVVLVSLDLPDARARAAQLAAGRAEGLEVFYLRDDGTGVDDVLDKVRLPIPTTLEVDANGVIRSVLRGVIE